MNFKTTKRSILILLSIFLIKYSIAENPIFTQRYTADPSGMEYNGRLYIYASHDIDGQTNYSMNDITCISTNDMVNWTDHGEVCKVPANASWATQAWAPSVVFRNNKFYMYFGDGNRSVAVALSDNPTGPFGDAKGSAVITKSLPNCDVPWCYDPSVFVDDDGQAYCYFGGGDPKGDNTLFNARVIKLGENMISTVGDAVTIPAPGFFEGGHIHKRTVNGIKKYYFSFFRNLNGIKIDYMMSDNPMTGWVSKGIALNTLPDNMSNNSQAGIFSFGDKWYIAYHNRKLAIDRGVTNMRQRSVCVDELNYNADFTIKTAVLTSSGPAQIGSVDPFVRNEAETMSSQSFLLPGIETIPSTDIDGNRVVTEIDNGDWVKISGVDFGSGASSFTTRVSSATNGGDIEIRLDSENGTLAGTCIVDNTGDWNKWTTKNCNLVTSITGKHDLFLKFTGGAGFLFNLNWWKFSQNETAINDQFESSQLKVIQNKNGVYKLSESIECTVFNIQGLAIFSGEDSEIDLSNCNKGIYILKTRNRPFKLINK